MERKAIVYILQSEDDDRYYVGSTIDLQRRLGQHAHGHTHSTKRMGSLKLVFSQEYPSLRIALAIERKIKSWKRKDFVDQIVRDGNIRFVGL